METSLETGSFLTSPEGIFLVGFIVVVAVALGLAKAFSNRPVKALLAGFALALLAMATPLAFIPEFKQTLISEAGYPADRVQSEYYKVAFIVALVFGAISWGLAIAARRGERIKAEKKASKAYKP